MRALTNAARPSQERLHHRDLFTDGRRYYVRPLPGGFQVMSDTRLFWGRRRRTRMAAVVNGTFSGGDEANGGSPITTVRLRARMSSFYALSSLLIPAFISSIVAYAAWPVTVRSAIVALLFILSWLGHRFDAAYHANEIMFFVQKALDDLPSGDLPGLPTAGPDIVIPARGDFSAEWQRFYEEQVGGDGEPQR